MQVLVTGGGGYIGSIMIPMLLEEGYKVKCLDRFFFGEDTLKEVYDDNRLELIRDDVRWFDPQALEDVDAVIDMAALSNDPSGELDPEKTMAINYMGRVRVANLAKKYGVDRYILASSCSIYGFQDGVLDENSPTNPLTTYSKANLLSEQETLPLSDNSFCVTVLRQATVYGLSPRMRFDLAINGMTLGFYKNGWIPVMRDGTQWRPFIHVKDTSRAFLKVLEADKEKVNGELFNTSSNDQNFQVLPLAEMVADAIGIPFKYEWYGDPDTRSYQVSFDKIEKTLNFDTKYTPRDGAKEIYDALQNEEVTDSIKTKTVEWYKYLIKAKEEVERVELQGEIL